MLKHIQHILNKCKKNHCSFTCVLTAFLGAAIPRNATVDKSDYKSGYVIGCFHHLQGGQQKCYGQ